MLDDKSSLIDQSIIDDIEKDICRTYPHHVKFQEKDGDGQNALRKLLRRYATLDPEIGYCQAMAFIAAMLLIYMDEQDAFYNFLAILQVCLLSGYQN